MPAAGPSRTAWLPPVSACFSSNAAATCRASGTTGSRPRSSSGGSTCPPSPGTTGTTTPSSPEVNYYVGGNTKFYGAALFRLRPEDFGELKHHDGISPAWPIDYGDLEPYYTQAEHLYRVHGRHGEDPFEGPYSADYAHPPVEHEPRIQQLSDDLEKQGLHPFHLPIGVNLDQDADGLASRGSAASAATGSTASRACSWRSRTPRSSAWTRPWRSGGVELLTGAYVERLETDAAGGSVTGVVVTAGREEEPVTFSADIVVVACGAVNSAALLLRSANDRHPNGLANSSDVVGRHYMRHNNLALMAVSKEPNPTRFQKTLALHDWYFGDEDWDYPLGGIQMLGKSDSRAGQGRRAPDGGEGLARRCPSR